jgi:hypothetical protein
MTRPLNLSPSRGPSVWDRLDRESKLERIGSGAVAAGTALAAYAMWGSRRHRWVLTLGIACLAAGLLRQRRFPKGLRRGQHVDPSEDVIDQTLADSFPASDPPSIPAAYSE